MDCGLARMEEIMAIAILDNYTPYISEKDEVRKASLERIKFEAEQGEYGNNGDILGIVYSRDELAAINDKLKKGGIDTFFIIKYSDSTKVGTDTIFDKTLNRQLNRLWLPEGIKVDVIAAVSNNGFMVLDPSAESVLREWQSLSHPKSEQKVSLNNPSAMFARRPSSLGTKSKVAEKVEETIAPGAPVRHGPAPAA